MTKLIFTLLLFLLAGGSFAQPLRNGRKTIGISAGRQQFRFQDQHASPLVYKTGSSAFFGLNYIHSTATSYFTIRAAGGTGAANPARFGARDYLTHWSDSNSFQYRISSLFVHANLSATYLKKLNASSDGPLGYWLGAAVNEQAYFADEVANMPWLINTLDISPSLRMDYRPGSRHLFSVSIDAAALGLFTRTVYGLFAKSNKDNNVISYLKQGTRFASPGKYQKVQLELNYSCNVSRRFGLGATCGLQWLHYSYPLPIQAFSSRFNVNLNYSLHP